MNVNYVLVATGNVSLPRVNHTIHAIAATMATEEATKVVAALHKAGYFQFTLYDTRRDNKDGADIQIATFRVEENEPTIIVK